MGDGQVVNNRAVNIIAVSSVFSIVAILAVILRFFARHYKGLGVKSDDYLMVLGLFFTLGVTINNIVGVAVAGIGEHEIYMTAYAADGFPIFPLPNELAPDGKMMFALQILHTCAMPIIKLSVLLMYHRLFQAKKWFVIAEFVIGGFVIAWCISVLFSSIFQCIPISGNWGTVPTQLVQCSPNIIYMYEVAAITNVITDLVILILPFAMILPLNVLAKKKAGILAIFLTGAVVVVAGVGRTLAYFQFKYIADVDFSYHYYAVVIWSSIEPTLGVIGGCLPVIAPIFNDMTPETVLNSLRNMFSIHSRHGPLSVERPQKDSSVNHAAMADDNGDGFAKLRNPNSSPEKESTAKEPNFKHTDRMV